MRVHNKIFLRCARGSKTTIGDDFVFTSGDGTNPLSRSLHGFIFADLGATITIGDRVGISSSSLRAKRSITIGNDVKIGGDCIILDTDSHSMDWRLRASQEKTTDGRSTDTANAVSLPIVIEDNVLIGARSIILKGVTIGARSVIGAGSVVTKDIPADCIAAGNPAKVIRQMKQK